MFLHHTVALCKIKERAGAAAAIFFRVNGPYHVPVKSFPPARRTPGLGGEHLPFELLADIFTVAYFITLLHPPLRRNLGPILDSCFQQRGANIPEAAVVGWLIVLALSDCAP